MAETHGETPLLVAFVDLTRFMAQSRRVSDADQAATLDAYHERVAALAEAAGGRMVKTLGDGALVVFPEDAVDQGVAALLDIKDAVDALMDGHGWDCRLTVKAHFGAVIAGRFGAASDKRYDVFGKTVNTAATLNGNGVTLSVEAFRQLSPELRKRFKKHTPPVTYIRVEDKRVR
jgi:class 3 adenylate cyclase